jgi:pimeloyl-ACP methyl ester carboxylesterase
MIVFVHGVPETAALWDSVRVHMDAESVALSLPGVGGPRPDGFGAAKDEYAERLVSELDRTEGPIDPVGHDWGAVLTYGVATTHGAGLRSWAADLANGMHPDYTWHDFAQIWQGPGAGEQFFHDQLASPPAGQSGVYEAFGVPAAEATAMAGRADEIMVSCILDLYRSAVPNVHASWGGDLAPTSSPGLVLYAIDDPFGDEAMSADVARMLRAEQATLDGVGHWWALQAPEMAAAVLSDFHGSLG